MVRAASCNAHISPVNGCSTERIASSENQTGAVYSSHGAVFCWLGRGDVVGVSGVRIVYVLLSTVAAAHQHVWMLRYCGVQATYCGA